MQDREDIIKGIQECDLNGGLIGNCPYKGILLLLKEQEPHLSGMVVWEGKVPAVDRESCARGGVRQYELHILRSV